MIVFEVFGGLCECICFIWVVGFVLDCVVLVVVVLDGVDLFVGLGLLCGFGLFDDVFVYDG